MNVSAGIAERGHNYYTENRVRYISLDGSKGYAIVEGSTAYEVEFEYRDGTISGLICSCFCSCSCKHEFAAMLQLKEALGRIEKTTQTNMRAPATLLRWTRARCSPSPSPARKPEASRYKRAIRFAFTPLNTPPGCFGPAKLSLRLPLAPAQGAKGFEIEPFSNLQHTKCSLLLTGREQTSFLFWAFPFHVINLLFPAKSPRFRGGLPFFPQAAFYSSAPRLLRRPAQPPRTRDWRFRCTGRTQGRRPPKSGTVPGRGCTHGWSASCRLFGARAADVPPAPRRTLPADTCPAAAQACGTTPSTMRTPR